MDTIPARGELLDLAIRWWLAHMQRDAQHITAVGLDGYGVLHFLWDDGLVVAPEPFTLSLLDLHLWNLTGQKTTTRHLPLTD